MSEQKFFICKHCGNLVGMIFDSGVPIVCCGGKMQELTANTVDASFEKHIPAVTREGDKLIVNIGALEHPMTEEHYIQWVYVKTEKGGMRRALSPNEPPHAEFCVKGQNPTAVYAYCNLHGLWLKEL